MDAKHLIMMLILAGTLLSGCVNEKPESAMPDTAPHTSPEQDEDPATEGDIASSEFAELELEDMERELAELEAMLNEMDSESDLLAEMDESLFT
ncbi:MAG: hypothetical protein EF813_05840 [Methanosarcinales archaeon]|nr:MAG: hypothetical protein EF813_05840 [Methanosarcinales archaeon]